MQNSSAEWLSCRSKVLCTPMTRICGVQKLNSGDVWLHQGSHPSVASLEGDEPAAEDKFQSPEDIMDRYSMGT